MKIDREDIIRLAIKSGFDELFDGEVGLIGDYNVGYELTNELEKFANEILIMLLPPNPA